MSNSATQRHRWASYGQNSLWEGLFHNSDFWNSLNFADGHRRNIPQDMVDLFNFRGYGHRWRNS